nr:uncharacterized protein LOC119625056 [Chlorocebus sabaeus]
MPAMLVKRCNFLSSQMDSYFLQIIRSCPSHLGRHDPTQGDVCLGKQRMGYLLALPLLISQMPWYSAQLTQLYMAVLEQSQVVIHFSEWYSIHPITHGREEPRRYVRLFSFFLSHVQSIILLIELLFISQIFSLPSITSTLVKRTSSSFGTQHQLPNRPPPMYSVPPFVFIPITAARRYMNSTVLTLRTGWRIFPKCKYDHHPFLLKNSQQLLLILKIKTRFFDWACYIIRPLLTPPASSCIAFLSSLFSPAFLERSPCTCYFLHLEPGLPLHLLTAIHTGKPYASLTVRPSLILLTQPTPLISPLATRAHFPLQHSSELYLLN